MLPDEFAKSIMEGLVEDKIKKNAIIKRMGAWYHRVQHNIRGAKKKMVHICVG